MKLSLLFLLCLLGSGYTQNCIYTNHCASDVCPSGSAIHCLDSRCKCLTLATMKTPYLSTASARDAPPPLRWTHRFCESYDQCDQCLRKGNVAMWVCFQGWDVQQSPTCTQKTDCPLGSCQGGNEMHCLDGHCKCLISAVSTCFHDDDCVASHNNDKHCGPADDDGRWKCHHNMCQCDHSD